MISKSEQKQKKMGKIDAGKNVVLMLNVTTSFLPMTVMVGASCTRYAKKEDLLGYLDQHLKGFFIN